MIIIKLLNSMSEFTQFNFKLNSKIMEAIYLNQIWCQQAHDSGSYLPTRPLESQPGRALEKDLVFVGLANIDK